MLRYLATIFLLILFPFNDYSQEGKLYFNHLTRNDGLSSNRINSIYEDSDGFMWFATEDGLSKFDGYSFEVFRNNPGDDNSIPDNIIDLIIEDKNTKNLILATSRGIVEYNRALNKFNIIFEEELGIRPGRNFTTSSLAFDNENHLWIATRQGLYHANLESQTIIDHFVHRTDNPESIGSSIINSLKFSKDDKLWIGHQEGLDIYDLFEEKFTHFHPEIDIKAVASIYEDQLGGLWIGSDLTGLHYFPDSKQPEYKHFSKETGHLNENRVHGITERSDSTFIIIVRDGGLYQFNLNNESFEHYLPDIYNKNSINSKGLISLFRSSQGIIWIGTYTSGINFIDPKHKDFEHYYVDFSENSLFNNNVRALWEDTEGYIWIGTKEEGGISRFDRKTKTFKNYKSSNKTGGLHDDYIFSICDVDSENLMIGTFKNGVSIFNKKNETFKYYLIDPQNPSSLSNRTYVVFKDMENRFWVGNQNELFEFFPSTGIFKSVPGIRVPKVIIDDGADILWIGTRDNGLYQFNKRNGNIEQYNYSAENTNSISHNDIYTIVKDQKGFLWIGSKRGLCRLDIRTDSITRYLEKDGLTSNWVCGIEIDQKDNLWISTINGLSKLDASRENYHNYDMKDGLQDNEFEGFVSLKTKDGFLLFGGRNGFNMFNPENIKDNDLVPEIVFTGFKLFNKDVAINEPGSPLSMHINQTKNLRLKHDQSAITIEYTALNFTSPEKNQYSYILEGFDTEWVEAKTQRSAVYTNIPPGDYIFKVIGSNNDGYWNETGASLSIEVLPPPWKTGLAYFIYFLMLISAFLLIRRMMVLRIEQKQAIEFERKDKKRIQELNQLKLRFFTNISHEFRTPLTLIAGPLEKLMNNKNENDEQSYLFSLINKNVKRLLLLINELMDFRKAEYEKMKLRISNSSPLQLINEIVECFDAQILAKKISIKINPLISERSDFWFDSTIIDKVLFNLLTNAFKYTSEGGRIIIDLTLTQNILNISVSDTGKGISKDNLEGIFERFYQVEDGNMINLSGSGIGLAFSKKLIEAHHGSIDVESLVNVGSKFSFHFPIDKESYSDAEIYKNKTSSFSAGMDLSIIKHEKSKSDATPSENQGKKLKLLIIEDNNEMRDFLVCSFNSFSLFEAEDGKKGYSIAIKELPDIIISDVIMPEMNGIEVCEKIKTNPATSHIPVILLSAETEVGQKIKGLDTGADAYVEKPFELDYLISLVRNLLKQREDLRKKFSEDPEIALNDMELTSHERKFIEKSFLIIEENIDNPDFSVENLGSELGLSRSQLFRKFKILFDIKPSELIRTERLRKAKKLLSTREFNINEVAIQTGFKSSSYFITSFKKQYGKTPNEFVNSLK